MENTQGMTADELAAQMPLEEYIPISEAAKILGGGVVRVKSLMELVMTGGLFSWSHSCPHHAPSRQIYHKINLEIELPNLTPETDPSTVLVHPKMCSGVGALKSKGYFKRWMMNTSRSESASVLGFGLCRTAHIN